MCEGINSNDFTLCSKYYEYEFSRETFERKVKAYRLQNKIGQEKPTIEKENTLNKIFNLIEKYRFYIASILTIILLILITLIISSRRKKKKVLE